MSNDLISVGDCIINPAAITYAEHAAEEGKIEQVTLYFAFLAGQNPASSSAPSPKTLYFQNEEASHLWTVLKARCGNLD